MFTNNKKNTVAQEMSNASNFVGEGTSIEGNLRATGNIRVDGSVVGEITTKAKIVLGASSKVKGNIVAKNAEVGGDVQGIIEISELLILKSTALVKGDIIATKLVFEEGAQFNGKCKMGKEVKKTNLDPNNMPAAVNKKNAEREKIYA